MNELALWLILASMTNKCFQTKTAEYQACQKANVAGSVCLAPSQFQGVTIAYGRPALSTKDGTAAGCMEIKAYKLSGGLKKFSLEEWNKQADKESRILTGGR